MYTRRARFFSSAATAISTEVLYTSRRSDISAPVSDPKITEIPIQFTPADEAQPPHSTPIPITVHLPTQPQSTQSYAAVKIQSVYRSHVVRGLVRKISAVNSEADYWQRVIQRQDTVDAIRTSERERIKINEALMGLLFSLDSVPGIDPNVRDLRRHVSRRIVGLQEILDAVSDTRLEQWDGYLRDWDDIVAGLEKEACEDKGGGDDLQRFCAEHLGFQCLQRFLGDH